MSILDDFALTYSIYNATFSANTEINVGKSAFQDTGVRSHHRPGIRRNVN